VIELLTLCLLGGALLYHTLHLGIITMLIASTLAGAFFFIYFLSRNSFLFSILIVSVVMLGAATVWFHDDPVPKSFFANRIVSGTVQNVNRKLDKTLFIVNDQLFSHAVQVTSSSDLGFLPGDSIQVAGAVQQPQDFMTDTGRIFPYQAYLQSKDIAGTMNNAHVKIISRGRWSLVRWATMLRFAIADIFTKYITFPIDGIVAGMLVGYQGGIPQNIQDLFRTTGVLHVLVLSGENITLLALFLSILLRTLPFKIRSFLTGIAIVLIVLISGAGVSAIRAGIMGCIALLAGLVHRSYMPLRALTISIALFFFISPETIFTDPGFHLSVLATLFMIIVFPKIEKLFHFLPERFNVRELLILALSVPLFMLPYTMYFSGLVSSASPLANILMAIVTPFFMLAGASILAVSWLVPFAQLAGTITSCVGSVIIKILEILNALPQLNTPPLAWWGVVASYLLFFGIVFRFELMQFWLELKTFFLQQANSSD
jgi:competence protein ComEC